MYLTRIAGIEPDTRKNPKVVQMMYLTRIAGIEPPANWFDLWGWRDDVSYPHSGN